RSPRRESAVQVVQYRTSQVRALSTVIARRAQHAEAISYDRPRIASLRFARNDVMTIAGALRRQRGLGLLDDRLEGRWLADREVGQNLAVDRDPGFAEAVDKSAVGEAEAAHRRVEALNPKGAERALAPLAVAEGVLVRLLDRLLGDADR